MKHTKKTRWGVADFDLVDKGIPILETIVYTYIKRFEKNKGPVWASIPHIARDVRMSESSVQRHIKHLLEVGLLKHKVKGRGRYLSAIPIKLTRINNVKLTTIPVKLTADSCQSDMNDPCQSDMLPKLDYRCYQPKLNNRESSSSKLITSFEFYEDLSLIRSKPEPTVDNSVDKIKASYENVWDEAKQTMVRRRLPS